MSLHAGHYLVVDQRKRIRLATPTLHTSIELRSVVKVRIERPMREDDIRLQRSQQCRKSLCLLLGGARLPVDLIGEHCIGPEQFTSPQSLGSATFRSYLVAVLESRFSTG